MNGLRFKEGEPAIYAFANHQEATEFVGSIVTIDMVGPFRARSGLSGKESNADYRVLLHTGETMSVLDCQLRKLDPPVEPASLMRIEECEVGV